MATLQDLVNDKRFQALSPQEQTELRARFFEAHVAKDPRYLALTDNDKLDIRRRTLGGPEQPGVLAGVASKFGFTGEPGLLERYVTGSPTTTGSLLTGGVLPSLARGLDTALTVAAALPTGIGNAAKDLIELGGAGVGAVTGLGPSTPTATPISELAELGASIAAPFGMAKVRPGPLNQFGITRSPRETVPQGTAILEPASGLEVPGPRQPSKVAELLHPEPYTQAKTPHVGGLGSEVPAQYTPVSQRESIERTLDAAMDLAVGRKPLDLGASGKARALRQIELDSAEAGKKVAVAADDAPLYRLAIDAPPSARALMPREIAGASDAISPGPLGSPSSFAVSIADIKGKAEMLTPRVFGFPIHELAKDIPGFRELVSFVYRGMDDARAIEHAFVGEINKIYKGLSKASIELVNRFLDGGLDLADLAPAEAQAAHLMRRLLDTVAEPGRRLTDYFPRIRDSISASVTDAIQVGGKELPVSKIIKLGEGAEYVPIRAQNMVPKRYTPFFEKARTAEEGATNFGIEPLLAYASGYARKAVLNGGVEPLTGRTLPGLLKGVNDGVKHVPEPLLGKAATWINDVLGVPGPKGAQVLGESTETATRMAMGLQFLRTIALNPLSAGLNLTQAGNTFARSRPASFFGAIDDLRNPVLRSEARRYGVTSDITKADMDLLASIPAEARLAALNDKLGSVFRGSENLVRLHAYFTGLREAAQDGLRGEAAINRARDFVSQTQFRFGREAKPETFRQAGLGQLLSQYKTFPINQALFMKNLLVDDLKNFGHELPFKRTAKYFGAMIGLFGSDAVTLGMDKAVSQFITGNEETLTAKGFFPSLGIYVANQIGLGVMPIEDFRSLAFFLPGPAASMVLDAASVASALPDLTGLKPNPDYPYGINYSPGPGFGQPMNAEQLAAKLTRMIPVGGVFANRMRKALVETQTPGEIRTPTTLGQAFGTESLTDKDALVQKGLSPLHPFKTAAGVQDPVVEARQELRHDESRLLEARNATVGRAARLWATGRQDDAKKLLENFEHKYGQRLILTPEAVINKRLESILDPATRATKKAPKDLRGPMLDRLRQLND